MKSLRYTLLCILLLVVLSSCDDGDIIVNSFSFNDETDLALCQQNNINVFHFIDQETNEAISFEFSLNDFDGTFSGFTDQTQEISLDINSTNKIVYRKLSDATNSNTYFCQQVPPSSPQVLEEFVSTIGGTATLLIRVSDQDDQDGIPAELEDRNENLNFFDDDSDEDGIPDFLDTDDDNDNVLTISEELEAEDENGNFIIDSEGNTVYVDTDNDGIPNYLDNNDDGDATLTINEDINACEDPENPALNPSNDINQDGLANYLNPDTSESVDIAVVKRNRIVRSFFTQVQFTNITFENQNRDESISYTNFIMGRYTVNGVSQDLLFNDTVTSEDEVENFCQ